MANKTLFQSVAGLMLPKTDARNVAAGVAYTMNAEHALAQLAARDHTHELSENEFSGIHGRATSPL